MLELKILTMFVFDITWKVIYPGLEKIGAGVSPVVKYVTRGHSRLLLKIMYRWKGLLSEIYKSGCWGVTSCGIG